MYGYVICICSNELGTYRKACVDEKEGRAELAKQLGHLRAIMKNRRYEGAKLKLKKVGEYDYAMMPENNFPRDISVDLTMEKLTGEWT